MTWQEKIKRKYNEDVELSKMNDEFEEKCREQLTKRFLDNN